MNRMHALYIIHPMTDRISEIVELSTRVRIYLGQDCEQWVKRMGIQVLQG